MTFRICLLTLSCFLSLGATAQELWITSYFGDTVRKYDLQTGQSLGTVQAGHLDGPLGMTAAPDGTISVTSEVSNAVEQFDRQGNWVRTLTGGVAQSPTAIAFDDQGRFAVAEFGLSRVSQFSPDGQFLRTLVDPGEGGLDGPDLGMTYGPDGNLYVPSFNNGAILRYDANGNALTPFVAPGDSGLTQPRQILWRDGVAYVSSDNGNRVLKFDAQTGAFLGNLFTPGLGSLNGAVGMVFRDDELLVTSWRNSRILRYDLNGNYLGVFASNVSSPVGLLIVPEPTSVGVFAALTALVLRRKKV